MVFGNISAAVLFVEDLNKCMLFYRDTLGLPPTFNDDVSYAFKLGQQDFVILKISAAIEMVTEAAMGQHKGGWHNVLLCTGVDDVDAVYKDLTAKGLKFIKPPISQAWGRRTAYFADPEGNLWELWQELSS